MPPFSVIVDALRSARPSQIAGRARRLVPPSVLATGPEPDPAWRGLARDVGVQEAPQGGPVPAPEADGAFHFIGRRIDADDPALFTGGSNGLLEAFHAQGFVDLPGYVAQRRSPDGDAFWTAVIERWLREEDEPGPVGWHPFPLSGRMIAWCAALSASGWPEPLAERMRRSLARQLRMLRRSVEHDVGGNHVLRNATALVVGGACLGDDRALRTGERLLAREVSRQLLPDGGHEERSTSYHREVRDDLRTAAAVLERAGRPVPWADALNAMDAWLGLLAAPDGSLPMLNDAWDGPPVVPRGDEAVTTLDGLIVLRGEGLHAVLDCAPLGPRHLPAHVHADALSFSLWVDGRWVVADPGTFTYWGPERDAFRGTAAHATLTVEGADQCRFWGRFRASGLPTVTHGPVERRDDGWLVVEARHDGFGGVVHVRRFEFHPSEGLVVEDRIEGDRAVSIESRLPLGPEADGVQITALGGESTVEPAKYSPHFGQIVDTQAHVLRHTLAPGETCGWSLRIQKR